MKHKSVPATVTDTSDEGVFEAVVSVFDNKDLGGDIVRPGAFSRSLAHWEKAGAPIPVYWSHRLDDPSMNIGEVIEAKELTSGHDMPEWVNDWVREHGGLYIRARLDDFGMGKQVRHLMKQRRVKQFSFTYDVITEQRSKDNDANELIDVFLHEVGPTPLGMNPLTELISAKNAPPPSTDDPPDHPSTHHRPDGAVFLCRTGIRLAEIAAKLANREENDA